MPTSNVIRFVAALGLYIVPSGCLCSEHVARDCLLLYSNCVHIVCVSLQILPACAICIPCLVCLYLSVGGSLQVLEQSPKQSKKSPGRVTIGGCRWTTGVGAFWDHAANKFGFEASTGGSPMKDSQVDSVEEEAAGFTVKRWKKVGADSSHIVLCFQTGEFCMIVPPKSQK